MDDDDVFNLRIPYLIAGKTYQRESTYHGVVRTIVWIPRIHMKSQKNIEGHLQFQTSGGRDRDSLKEASQLYCYAWSAPISIYRVGERRKKIRDVNLVPPPTCTHICTRTTTHTTPVPTHFQTHIHMHSGTQTHVKNNTITRAMRHILFNLIYKAHQGHNITNIFTIFSTIIFFQYFVIFFQKKLLSSDYKCKGCLEVPF